MRPRAVSITAALVILSSTQCFALNIVVDYSNDSFFASHLTAKASLEAAAADLSSAITTTLNATTDTNSATVSGVTATFNFRRVYTNPTTGATQFIESAVVPSNEVRVFAGMRNLPLGNLGQGGAGSFGVNISYGSGSPTAQMQAMAMAQAAANTNVRRGDGPQIGNLSDTVGSIPFSVNYGQALGSVWFTTDTNGDGATDNEATLQSAWHFDYTTPVAAGKDDFYSVALHELLHSLGFSSSDSWDAKAAGSNWTGSSVINLLGSGSGVLQSDSQHIAEGRMSVRLSDGVPQEAVMDPSLTAGTRKKLTLLDLAFMQDIGWDTVPLTTSGDFDDDGDVDSNDIDILWHIVRGTGTDPHGNDSADLDVSGKINEDDVDYMLGQVVPLASGTNYGDADLDDDVDGNDFDRWRMRTGYTGPGSGKWSIGDFDGDGDVDGADYDLWGTRPTVFPTNVGPHAEDLTTVPEPASWLLMAVGLAALLAKARLGRAMYWTACVAIVLGGGAAAQFSDNFNDRPTGGIADPSSELASVPEPDAEPKARAVEPERGAFGRARPRDS